MDLICIGVGPRRFGGGDGRRICTASIRDGTDMDWIALGRNAGEMPGMVLICEATDGLRPALLGGAAEKPRDASSGEEFA